MGDLPDERRLNMTLVGDARVGKSILLQRLEKDLETQYRQSNMHEYEPTLMGDSKVLMVLDPKSKEVEHFDSEKHDMEQAIQLDIWDTSGDPENAALRSVQYANTDCFVMVYDMTRPETLAHVVTQWSKELDEATPPERKNFPTYRILVGAKSDLVRGGAQGVNYGGAYEVARRTRCCAVIETSAEDMSNVHELQRMIISVAQAYHNRKHNPYKIEDFIPTAATIANQNGYAQIADEDIDFMPIDSSNRGCCGCGF
eukprot:TRINITY_DN20277_c0_g1_i1.p1 TRINITY_DN20277_c0_g1~~TRINITY_DN20277_c0_g1_i1.p1  ORF type:complete len:256 (-),score=60.12 TRINITY_DN20277_c0_g1_i1:172-939(-)